MLSQNIQAAESHSGSTTNCDERLVARIILTATTNAPPGAIGIAKLKSDTEDGVTETILRLRVSGLVPGEYLLGIVTQSDGATTTLGQFTVSGDDDHSRSGHTSSSTDTSHSGDSDDDSDFREQDHSERSGDTSRSRSDDDDDDGDGHLGDATEIELSLPSEIDPLDIGQITVSDTAGVVLLVGDLMNPNPATTLKFRGLVSITAGEGAPSARGKAQMQSQIRKGKRHTRFTLVASQVPAEATFHVQVNGSGAGIVKSSRKGRLVVKKLPPQKFHVRSVRLMDSRGKSAVSTSF